MRWTYRLAGARSSRVVIAMAMVFTVWIVLDALWLGTARGLNRATYDAMVRARAWVGPADPRIVIVDIDEPSLARMAPEFGRWPWPRDTLATVMAHLERQGAVAIAWDILFADPDTFHPGGDRAFDTAAAQSRHSHFSVVRLPAGEDARSQLAGASLPRLWAAGPRPAHVALIPPFLPALAAAPLGFNNNAPDEDGVVRRYRYGEVLGDGSIMKSLALSVAESLAPARAATIVQDLASPWHPAASLLDWRSSADAYPRVPMHAVFAEAEGGARAGVDWRGKVVLVGSTAPSLHDYHPSPVSPHHAGIEVLATAIDDALNRPLKPEIPRTLLVVFAIAICWLFAWWALARSVASLEPLLLAAPLVLLGVSYLSLFGPLPFLELQMPAAVALSFLAALRVWSVLRRAHWCDLDGTARRELSVLPLERPSTWNDAALDRLIDAVEKAAPDCRIVAPDVSARWPARPRWPELGRFAALVGSPHAIDAARTRLGPALQRLGCTVRAAVPMAAGHDRAALARECMRLWALPREPMIVSSPGATP